MEIGVARRANSKQPSRPAKLRLTLKNGAPGKLCGTTKAGEIYFEDRYSIQLSYGRRRIFRTGRKRGAILMWATL